MKRCLIITGGEFGPIDRKEDDFVIACDHGYSYALREGIKPDLLLGDFDSYPDALPDDLTILRFPVEKDDTDTMLAVREAAARGCEAVKLCCAFGGRLDHLFANIQTLAFAAMNGLEAEAEDERNYMRVLRPGEYKIEKQADRSLSFFALSDSVEGFSIHGTKYCAENVTINNTFPIGVSNKFEDDAALSFRRGMVLMMMCRE